MVLREIATHHLEKCYAINSITLDGKPHIVVAAEKINKCLLFDQSGLLVDTIWEEPGGTMSIVPLPDQSGAFLASQLMYSPNDSKEAKVVRVERRAKGSWKIDLYLELPFIHRFDILRTPTANYFIGATIKSDHAFKDDWSSPGKIWVGRMDTGFKTPPILTEYLGGLTRNHGFCKRSDHRGEYAVVSADEGVFAIYPPSGSETSWSHEQLLDTPTSDILFVDFDGDGEEEMLVISPFHGDEVSIYKMTNGQYQEVYRHPEPLPFAHALWTESIAGTPTAFLGHRKGPSRDLYAISWNGSTYQFEMMLKDVGSTNLFGYRIGDTHYLVSANREIDQIGFYEIEGTP